MMAGMCENGEINFEKSHHHIVGILNNEYKIAFMYIDVMRDRLYNKADGCKEDKG